MLRTDEIVALTLAYGSVADSRFGDEIPGSTWDRLYERGFIRNEQDITGEHIVTITDFGLDALRASVRSCV